MKLPPIAEKLRPAINLLDVLNHHLSVEDYFFSEDESWVEVKLRGEQQHHDVLDGMVYELLAEAHGLLPPNYAIEVRSRQFAVVPAETEQPSEPEAESSESLSSDFIITPLCFRLEPAVRAAFDEHGNPTVAYGYFDHYHLLSKALTELEKAEAQRLMAKHCACAIEHVTPISLEEYLAAGNSLEG